jgi:serine protease Do
VQVFGGGSHIGVSARDVDADEAKTAKIAGGVYIEDVREDSPASRAGFREGDIVVEFDGERVRSMRQFTRLVQETPSGREVPAVVMRDGSRTTLSVTPDAAGGWHLFDGHEGFVLRPPVAPPAPAAPAPPSPPAALEMWPRLERFFSTSGRLGVTVDAMPDQLAEYFGTQDGVLVTSVAENSAAQKAGLKAGDVIVTINGTVVNSPSELSRRAQRLEDGDEFTLEVVRGKQKQTLKGTVEAPRPRRWTASAIL